MGFQPTVETRGLKTFEFCNSLWGFKIQTFWTNQITFETPLEFLSFEY
jgi:hypothetical protein